MDGGNSGLLHRVLISICIILVSFTVTSWINRPSLPLRWLFLSCRIHGTTGRFFSVWHTSTVNNVSVLLRWFRWSRWPSRWWCAWSWYVVITGKASSARGRRSRNRVSSRSRNRVSSWNGSSPAYWSASCPAYWVSSWNGSRPAYWSTARRQFTSFAHLSFLRCQLMKLKVLSYNHDRIKSNLILLFLKHSSTYWPTKLKQHDYLL